MQHPAYHRETHRIRLIGCLVLWIVCIAIGCEQRVVSRKVYSPQQFSGVAAQPVSPATVRDEPKRDILGDLWHGMGNLFKKKPKPPAKTNQVTLTPDEIQKLKAQLHRDQDGKNPSEQP